MKIEILKRPWRDCWKALRVGPQALMFGLAVGAAAPLAHGAAVLDTLGGGPLQGYPNPAGYLDGNTFQVSQFNFPSGLALNTAGTTMYIADRANDAIRKITAVGDTASSLTLTFLSTNNGISRPVAVAVDSGDSVYVLNRGNGNNGTVLQFTKTPNPLGTRVANLTNATALALDGSTNIFVTIKSNTVLRVSTTGTNVVGVVTNAGTYLKGIAVLDSGLLALSDAGNQGIWLLNPANGAVTKLTGFNGPGDAFGEALFAQFRGPEMIAKAGNGMLVVADRGNNRVKVVDPLGTVQNLYGVSSNYWVYSQGALPGWWDGTVCADDTIGCPEAREPLGVTVAANGDVYSTEVFYHLFRKTTSTGLSGPNGGGGGGTNVVTVVAPSFAPNSGYFPMGRTITINSPNPEVHYTTDGTVPTLNSPTVAMSGNVGQLRWSSSTNDLTGLRVRAFVGTNASATVSGVPATNNSVGVIPGLSGQILAGVGSKIVVPVVADLRTNDQIKSFIFRLEITPGPGAPVISDQFAALNISSNDFISVVTAAKEGAIGLYSAQPYLTNSTRGLAISAIGTNANMSFQHFGIVAMIAIPIPTTAQVGQTYTLNVLNSSATADGAQAVVAFPPKPAMTILVTNVAYTVGDCALGGWYNAGDFGNNFLDNADVNNAFYAATGLRIPYPFSDVYDSMDAWPPDDFGGFLGGDGELTFLDWQVTLQRALGLDANNWIRAWSTGGDRTNAATTLGPWSYPDYVSSQINGGPWNRQALVGALPVGNVNPGATVNVPVYVRTASAATLRGLQFRCMVTPDNGGPGLAQAPTFVPAGSLVAPIQQSFTPSEFACAWSLNVANGINCGAHSSNYLGTVRFTVPVGAVAGQTYTISFANADGAPDLYTQYIFESKRATISVGAPAVAVTDPTSDEWKLTYFGSLEGFDPNADADHDGVPNWAEYLAGTSPIDPASHLQFDSTTSQLVSGQRRVKLDWLTAAGKTYEILAGSSPTTTTTLIGTLVGDGTVRQFTDPNPTNPRFYRLRVQP